MQCISSRGPCRLRPDFGLPLFSSESMVCRSDPDGPERTRVGGPGHSPWTRIGARSCRSTGNALVLLRCTVTKTPTVLCVHLQKTVREVCWRQDRQQRQPTDSSGSCVRSCGRDSACFSSSSNRSHCLVLTGFLCGGSLVSQAITCQSLLKERLEYLLAVHCSCAAQYIHLPIC